MILTWRCTAFLLGCAVLAIGCQSAPRSIEQQVWTRFASKHFEMWSSAQPAPSQRLLEDFERFNAALASLEPTRLRPWVRIVAFGDPRSFDQLRRSPEHQSVLLQTMNGPVLLVDASAPEAKFALRHAYLHATFQFAGETADTAWYQEGRAEYLSHLELDTNSIWLGVPPGPLASSLQFGDPLPLRRLLGAGASRAGWSAGEHLRFRAQSWALVHLLRAHEQETLDAPYAQLAETISAWRDRSDGAQTVGGDDIEILQTLFTQYFRQGSFAKFQLPIALAEAAPINVRPAASASASAVLIEVSLEMNASDALAARLRKRAIVGAPAQTASALRLALGDPTVPGPQLAASIEQWEAIPPANAEEWTEVGDSWRALAAREPELGSGRAATAYHRALELDPNDIKATVGLAATFGTSWEDHTTAAMLLRRAASERPGVARIELALADRLTNAGQPRRAALVLKRLANLPHVEAILDHDVLQAALDRTNLGEVDQQLWDSQLVVRTPHADAELEQLAPWVEVTGRAGLGETPLQDIVVMFDISESTLAPSGIDVNDNGVVGRRSTERRNVLNTSRTSREPFPRTTRVTTTDRGDSIGAAEKAVALELVRQLDPATTRVAVIAYAYRAFGIAPLGSPEAAEAALETFGRNYLVPETAGIHTGLIGALALLRSEQATGPRRRSSVLLVTGALPTQPNYRRARRRAIETAATLGELGIQLHTFSVGKQHRRLDELLLALSQVAGGTHAPVRYPEEAQLPNLAPMLAGLGSVDVKNHTSGATARARRIFSDGSFDAIAPLVEGENRLEIVAELPGREPLRETRTVHYTVPEEPTSTHRRRAAVLLWELRNRSIEVATRLQIAEAQAKRARGSDPSGARRVEVTIEVEEDAEPDAAAAPGDLEVGEAIADQEVGSGGEIDAKDDENDVDVAAPPKASDER